MRDFSQAEKLYVDELRAFRTYLQSHTSIAELKALNLLGVQFALCEASKYLVFLRYGSGPMYKPSTRDFLMTLQDASEADAQRLRAIWNYWEETVEEVADVSSVAEDSLHPDHRVDFP